MADEPSTQQVEQPTPEEHAQMTEVSVAGATAANAGEDPAAAMKAKRDEVGFVKLDDETIEKLADLLSDKNIEKMDVRGAFDPAPEPVGPPERPTAPPAPGAEQPAESQAPPPPEKKTPAHRFLGL